MATFALERDFRRSFKIFRRRFRSIYELWAYEASQQGMQAAHPGIQALRHPGGMGSLYPTDNS